MYFSGINISVFLTNPPPITYKAEFGSEILTLPTTGRFVKTNTSNPWVTFQDYKTNTLHHMSADTLLLALGEGPMDYAHNQAYFTKTGKDHKTGGLLGMALDEAWPKGDYDVLWDFVNTIKNKLELNTKYPGTDSLSKYTADGSMPLDTVAIQFSAEQEATPIFSPSFQYFETAMKASSLVQGAITLNYDERLERQLLGTKNEMDIVILYKKEDELSKEDDGYYELIDAPPPGPYTSYTLTDVRFISRSHSVQPTAEAIVETYQFIARSIE